MVYPGERWEMMWNQATRADPHLREQVAWDCIGTQGLSGNLNLELETYLSILVSNAIRTKESTTTTKNFSTKWDRLHDKWRQKVLS